MINRLVSYFEPSGQPTDEALKLFGDMERRIQNAEDKLTAIAAVTAPTGGATTDAEARAAINAILTAAG